MVKFSFTCCWEVMRLVEIRGGSEWGDGLVDFVKLKIK